MAGKTSNVAALAAWRAALLFLFEYVFLSEDLRLRLANWLYQILSALFSIRIPPSQFASCPVGCDVCRGGPNQLFDLLLLETLAMAMEHVGGWGSWLRWA